MAENTKSDFWASYWGKKKRNDDLRFYCVFAPLLEQASALLFSAATLWHPWSLRRRMELRRMAATLSSAAEDMRRKGIAAIAHDWQNAPYVLKGFARNYSPNNSFCEPLATSSFAAGAARILLLLFEGLDRMTREGSDSGLTCHSYTFVKNLENTIATTIEDLMEAPYATELAGVTNLPVDLFFAHGILLECEGLAYCQALAEDRLPEKERAMFKRSRSRSRSFTEKEISALASKIDVDPHVLKDVFDSDYSAWWDQVEEFRKLAQTSRAAIVRTLISDEHLLAIAEPAFEGGGVSVSGYEASWIRVESVAASAEATTAIIAMLRSFMPSGTRPAQTSPLRIQAATPILA